MKIDDEIYVKLNDLWWDVLNSNKDVTRFKDEFYDAALNDGFEIDDIEQFWNFGG